MRNTSRLTPRRLVQFLAAVALLASASYCAAVIVQRNLPMILPGVTAQGNLDDFDLAGPGEAIARYFPRLGLIIQTSRGNVTNESRRLKVFVNTGSVVYHPGTGELVTANADLYVVTRRGGASLLALATNVD